jgi:hypothetical protein
LQSSFTRTTSCILGDTRTITTIWRRRDLTRSREFDWMRLDLGSNKSCPRYISAQGWDNCNWLQLITILWMRPNRNARWSKSGLRVTLSYNLFYINLSFSFFFDNETKNFFSDKYYFIFQVNKLKLFKHVVLVYVIEMYLKCNCNR